LIFSGSKAKAVIQDLVNDGYYLVDASGWVDIVEKDKVNIILNDAIIESDYKFYNQIYNSFISIQQFLMKEFLKHLGKLDEKEEANDLRR
jgi:hypothetical protein